MAVGAIDRRANSRAVSRRSRSSSVSGQLSGVSSSGQAGSPGGERTIPVVSDEEGARIGHDAAGARPAAGILTEDDLTVLARLEAELAALASLVTVTGRARSAAEVADAALDILCRATGADAGLVTSMDEDAYRATASRNVDPRTIDVIVSYGALGGPLAGALRAPDAYIAADVATGPLREDVREAVLADGIFRIVVVGLRLAGRLTGLLALGWRRRPPTDPSPVVVRQAAALVAAAIANARLIAAVERGLAEERLLNRRMRALVELTRLPAAPLADRAAADRLLADLMAVLGADGVALGEIEGDRLRPVSTAGMDLDWVGRVLQPPLDELPIARELRGGAPAVLQPTPAAWIDPAGSGDAGRRGYRSIAAFGIRDEGQLVAVLYAVFRRPVADLELDARTLEAIGRVLDISFANRRLREGAVASESRYRELFLGSPDAIIVQTADGRVIEANPAAHRMFGSGVLGHESGDLLSGGDSDGSGTVDGSRSDPTIGRRLDGTTFPAEVDVRAIEIGGERRTLAIVRDLTERTRLQSELVQAQKMEAIGLLVAGVAHELNNPLAAIVAFSQLLRSDPNLPTDLHGQADLLVQEANRTRVIVSNLLDFARQRPPERVESELRPMIESVLGLQSYLLHQGGLSVDVEIPGDLPHVWLDRSQFRQVLVNLTVNAAQAVRSLGRPGRMSIRASTIGGERDRRIRIAIADDGPGVPAEILDRLFVPFVTTKPPGEGTGLGLSVSFGIVAAHGGTIRHEPTPGGGATFVIELPVRGPEPTSDDAFPEGTELRRREPRSTDGSPLAGAAGPLQAASSTSMAARILVLDDEPAIRDFLARVISRNGWTPILASTGVAALDIVRSDPPDAVLCDYRMAGMSGIEFHDAVAELQPTLARRFAFMSGDVLNPELREFATARGVPLLAKPFDIATAAAMVRGLLGVEVS
jgi:PAS domain S-box-containing protein